MAIYDPPSRTPTTDQLRFVDELTDRFDLRLDDEDSYDYYFVKDLLDAFAFDSKSPYATGFRRVNVIKNAIGDGQEPEYIANKLDMPAHLVKFIIKLLISSGHNLEQVEEDLNEDPEDIKYQNEIRRFG